METKEIRIVQTFNNAINEGNVELLSSLMTEDHIFIDRKGEIDRGKESMTKGWIDFFNQFPEYKNYFNRVESRNNLVILIGYAKWSKNSSEDHAIWTAKIEDDLVAEWRIYENTEENRRNFQIF